MLALGEEEVRRAYDSGSGLAWVVECVGDGNVVDLGDGAVRWWHWAMCSAPCCGGRFVRDAKPAFEACDFDVVAALRR